MANEIPKFTPLTISEVNEIMSPARLLAQANKRKEDRDKKVEKKIKRKENFRFWFPTIFAILAFILAAISLTIQVVEHLQKDQLQEKQLQISSPSGSTKNLK